jgi:Domain of unknown function (DUF1848)
MILSVSRRTDIPNYYADWFYNRISEGFLYVKNPMNPHQISKIQVTPELVDCIVFWTKNPTPMLSRLEELKDYTYCFQFTLTSYGKEIEPNLPHKKETMIPVFQNLSKKIGKERIIWRYDPIILTDSYSVSYHMKAFEQIAGELQGYTDKVIISFLDWYAKMKQNMENVNAREPKWSEVERLALHFSSIAKENHMEIETCAEKLDLSSYGIRHGSCMDKRWLENILGYKLTGKKDKNQRMECGCMESIEVGTYHTCLNGCKYCYANDSFEKAKENYKKYDVNERLLCARIEIEDKITERKIKSLKEQQLNLFE